MYKFNVKLLKLLVKNLKKDQYSSSSGYIYRIENGCSGHQFVAVHFNQSLEKIVAIMAFIKNYSFFRDPYLHVYIYTDNVSKQ
jgi:hypothetical protein